jgi:hypothetical protein
MMQLYKVLSDDLTPFHGGCGRWTPLLDAGDKLVARRARITERVTVWDERTARLFAADCAERVLPVFERTRPSDMRPRDAIATARRYAAGEATDEELSAAGAAAYAAGDAAGDVRGAAWAARSAAWAAGDATMAAAWAARDADWATYAASAASSAAEGAWQAQHLAGLLGLPWDVES